MTPPHLSRCQVCTKQRRALNSRLLRGKISDLRERSAVNSHTNYHWLTKAQMQERLHEVQGGRREAREKLRRLTKKIEMALDKRGVAVDTSLNSDLVTVMEQQSSEISQRYAPGSFPRLFWDAQRKCATLKDQRSMRWDPLMIKWCIYLRHLSSKGYETLRESGVVHLPSQRTLRDYTHYIPATSGLLIQCAI